jgi:transcriptional regulator with XRE-family HTH domain
MTGAEMALLLGCSEATVSRLRSGERTPSVRMMNEIRRVLAWSVEQQAAAIEQGSYGPIFTNLMDKRRVRRRHRRGRVAG